MGMVASERVFKVLDDGSLSHTQGSYAPATILGSIEFDDVWFALRPENYVLKNMNFQSKSRRNRSYCRAYE